MTEHPQPNWESLPDEPESFFELSGEYDLRDLKRSYNRLIRRFKPEKFPAEFQRIRAAYEELSDALRYNLPKRRPQSSNWEVTELRDASQPSPLGANEDTPADQQESLDSHESDLAPAAHDSLAEPLRALHQRITVTTPQALFQELEAGVNKSAEDYLALALLSDVVATDDWNKDSFQDWLLQGIAEHPDDYCLLGVLREYLAEDHSLDELASLLLRAVDVVPTERFQYITERAWDRLLAEASFEQFRDCLERCGARLGRSIDPSQLVFYVHMLKLAMWKADDDFITDILQTVNDHYETLDYWAQEEFEMVCALLDYRAVRDEFIQRGPCCLRIDQAIRDWCVLSETAGDLSVLDCHYFLSMCGQRLLEEFPDPDDDLACVLIPWDRIVYDVLDRIEEPEPPDETVVLNHVRDFAVRIMRRSKWKPGYTLGLTLIVVALAVVVVTLVASGSFGWRMCLNLFGDGNFLGALWDGCLAVGALFAGLILSAIMLVLGRRLSRVPYAVVRGELIKLLRVAPLRVEELAEVIEAQEDETYGDDDTIDDTDLIGEGLREDAAMEFFGLAQLSLYQAR